MSIGGRYKILFYLISNVCMPLVEIASRYVHQIALVPS